MRNLAPKIANLLVKKNFQRNLAVRKNRVHVYQKKKFSRKPSTLASDQYRVILQVTEVFKRRSEREK
jgi:hypothetical protein